MKTETTMNAKKPSSIFPGSDTVMEIRVEIDGNDNVIALVIGRWGEAPPEDPAPERTYRRTWRRSADVAVGRGTRAVWSAHYMTPEEACVAPLDGTGMPRLVGRATS